MVERQAFLATFLGSKQETKFNITKMDKVGLIKLFAMTLLRKLTGAHSKLPQKIKSHSLRVKQESENTVDVFKHMKRRKKMKQKLKKGMAIFLAIVLLQLAVITPVKAYEIGEYAKLENYGYYACMSKNGNNVEIEQMMYHDGRKNYPSYFYTYPKGVTYQKRKTIRQGVLDDDNLRRIILAGYPYHSYSELGCYSEYPAYLATQLCILEYTQGEILSQYQALNNQGSQVETAIQRIKENIAKQSSLGQVPVFELVANTEWEDYHYDPNYIFKTMQIECVGHYPGIFTIHSEDSRIEFLNEANYPLNGIYPSQTWKIRLPKTVQETGIELSFEISTSHETDTMWLASSTENGEMFILTQGREETIKKTYTETIEAPKEPIPENPGEENNPEEESKNPSEENTKNPPEETQEPEEKPETKPEEKPEEKPNDSHQPNSENVNQNENNQQNNQQVNLVLQPNIPIQNTIKQENQTNITVQIAITPETLQKESEMVQTEKKEQTIVSPKINTSASKKIITAKQIKEKKLPRTGY